MNKNIQIYINRITIGPNNMIPNQNITPHSATLHDKFGNPSIKGLSLEFKLTRSLETYEAVTRPQSHLTASIVNSTKTS